MSYDIIRLSERERGAIMATEKRSIDERILELQEKQKQLKEQEKKLKAKQSQIERRLTNVKRNRIS